MNVENRNVGICRLCKKERVLTKEHVPPRSAYNKNTKYTLGYLLDFMKKKNPLNSKVEGRFNQGGVGFYAFCAECNSWLGRKYVNSYRNWVIGGLQLLYKNENNFFEYRLIDQSPNRVLKQIISMFIAIHEPEFTDSNPELLEFVKDEKSNTLSSKFRVFMYLNNEGMLRYNILSAVGKINPPSWICCSEITFPPYGYILMIDHKGTQPYLCEITHFKNYEFNCTTELTLTAPKLPTILPTSLDYRTREQIEVGLKDSNV